MKITVLRYGHRRQRDNRASMHVALVARAFGAQKLIYCGDEDKEFAARVKKVVDVWGGNFDIEYAQDWIEYMKKFKGKKVHLTMYGERVQDKATEIGKCEEELLVFVGSQKVPMEAYELADFNIAVTNQPHSEIAALAIFLDRMFRGKELEFEWEAKKNIIPSKKSKVIRETK